MRNDRLSVQCQQVRPTVPCASRDTGKTPLNPDRCLQCSAKLVESACEALSGGQRLRHQQLQHIIET